MKNIAIFLFVSILLFTFPTQGVPSNIQNILTKVMASDGYLDDQLHREFWTEMEGMGSPEDTLKLINMFKLNMQLSQEYQREAWKSVLISERNFQKYIGVLHSVHPSGVVLSSLSLTSSRPTDTHILPSLTPNNWIPCFYLLILKRQTF